MPQSGGLIALQEVKLVEFGRKRRLLLNLMKGGMRGGGGGARCAPPCGAHHTTWRTSLSYGFVARNKGI